MTDKIRFLHIPKTAGSTFDDCLFIEYLRAYLLRQRFTFTGDIVADQARYRNLSPRIRQRIVICAGHAPRITGLSEIDSLPTVTLLRNPLERVKSFCRHVSEGKSPLIHSDGHQCFDLDEFLASGRIQLNNFQSRMLLGETGYALPPGSDEHLAQRAVELLRSELSCFGITEELERSLLMFRQVLGWRKLPIYRSRNSSNPQAMVNFEQRHIERIISLNQVDIRMYELATKLFYRQLAERCPDLEGELARFRQALAKPHPIFRAIDLARGIKRAAG